MKAKRGKNPEGNDPPNESWEPVNIEEALLMNKEFENLISFEVLSDYKIVKKAPEAKDVDDDKSKKAKSKRKSEVGTEVSGKQRKLVEESAPLEKGSGNRVSVESASGDLAWGVGSSNPWVVTEDNKTGVNEEDSVVEPEVVKNTQNSKAEKQKPGKKRKLEKANNKTPEEPVSDVDENEAYQDMEDWIKMGVTDPVLQALYDKKFGLPTPIQRLTLPSAILGRKDIVGAAETGSGKTLAFGIPIIEGILKEIKENGDNRRLKALILTPTRELAVQVKDHIKDAAKHTKIQAVVIVGGLATQKQERLLAGYPEIVIGTPGRLWELIQEGNEHLSTLSEISYLAVDETDRMVEKGHFQELQGILAAINSDPEKTFQRQNFIFSATLSFTHEMPHRFKKTSMKAKKMKQVPKKVNKKEKLRQIMELVGVKENAKVVDITEKRGTCETLVEMQLTCQLAYKDYYLYYFFIRHPALHSDMHQKQRLRSLENFTANDNGILIATDVAARGLDIVDIQHVIHYQVPKTAESYIHRSGRTARAFKGGLAILFVEPKEHTLVSNIMRSLDRDEAFPAFHVDDEIFKEIKSRVDMAVKVEAFEHSVRKRSADQNWLDKAKKEMDLASTSEEESDDDEDYQKGSKGVKKNLEKAKRELELCKQKLSKMLSVNLFLRKPKTDVRTTFKKLSKIKAIL
ncbi:unnamed protein product [Allacma fusca]|uniref:ATP-dependent RNA helicase n=1 Tax=Allacma fusca TaxID=39272 RepID=A0A8J2JF76_9HEXA|nr:unnamed protein product [Allacma fusca]